MWTCLSCADVSTKSGPTNVVPISWYPKKYDYFMVSQKYDQSIMYGYTYNVDCVHALESCCYSSTSYKLQTLSLPNFYSLASSSPQPHFWIPQRDFHSPRIPHYTPSSDFSLACSRWSHKRRNSFDAAHNLILALRGRVRRRRWRSRKKRKCSLCRNIL